jgi:hypothetical protein
VHDIPLLLFGSGVFGVVTLAVLAGLLSTARQSREQTDADRELATLVRRRQAYLLAALPTDRSAEPVRLPFLSATAGLDSDRAQPERKHTPRDRTVAGINR